MTTRHNQPSRNFRCKYNSIMQANDIDPLFSLINCTKHIGFHDWTNKKVLGKGSFGEVSSYDVKDLDGKDIKVAIKIANFEINKNDQYELDDLYDEVEYNFYMAEVNLGPKIYYTFFEITDETKDKLQGRQYFIMEQMDMDIHAFLSKKNIPDSDKQQAIAQIVELLRKQIYDYNLFCSDTKPQNCMISLDTNKVRLIDFGGKYCNVYTKLNKETMDIFYLTQLLQLKIMIKYAVPSYDSSIYDPINLDPIFKKACDYLNKYGKRMYLNESTLLYHYSDNNAHNIYEAANCKHLINTSIEKFGKIRKRKSGRKSRRKSKSKKKIIDY